MLIRSDGHPNVVRYFLKEQQDDFVYLGLQLCEMSLKWVIQSYSIIPNIYYTKYIEWNNEIMNIHTFLSKAINNIDLYLSKDYDLNII